LIDLILKGILTGFILSIMIGPVFFLLLETSIRKGIRAALAFDFGVLFSDLIYILIAYLFYSEVETLTAGKNTEIAKIIGGSLFIVYGLVTFFKKFKPQPVDEDGKMIAVNDSDNWKSFLKGFALNITNPMVIFYWFSVMTLASKSTHLPDGKSVPVLAFIGIILVTFFAIDVLKIIGAKQLRPLMTENLLKALNQLIGIVFLGFGTFLLINAFIQIKV
jgi:threonine/homoserine/homoserine lactone efflux protein